MRSDHRAGLSVWIAATLLISSPVLAADAPAAKDTTASEERILRVPKRDIGAETLEARKAHQLKKAKEYKVFHDFQFVDRLPESGITFVNRITPDSAKDRIAVHYDHGDGVVASDVDGDGKLDIYFVSQLPGNQLWKNLGGGKFKNITAEAGVGMPGEISVAATFADIDNDGDADLYVTTVRTGNVLFENDGKGKFKDISKQSGLDYVGHSSGAVFFDYNNDGRLDCFLVNVGKYTGDKRGVDGYYIGHADAFHSHLRPERNEPSVLYRNEGKNRFVDVTKDTGLVEESWSGDASIVDLNEDGWLDVYVLNMQGNNHYFENQKGEKFVDKTSQYFPKTSWGGMGIKFFDFDNNGHPDLYVTDMHSDMGEAAIAARPKDEKKKYLPPVPEQAKAVLRGWETSVFGNSFYMNLGGGKLEEVSDKIGAENYWPWGLSVADLNADGWDDAFVASSMNFPFRYGINSVLLNEEGKVFRDSEFAVGVEPRRDGRTKIPWFEIECDGADKKHELCKDRQGHWTVHANLGSRSSVIFDLDDDGDLDIVTNEFNSEPIVFVSNLSDKKKINWLKVVLEGTKSNRDAVGAAVKVTVGGKAYTKWNDAQSGYLSHGVLPLYFGLGDATKVDKVEVRWPSGKVQEVTTGIDLNEPLKIKEEGSAKSS